MLRIITFLAIAATLCAQLPKPGSGSGGAGGSGGAVDSVFGRIGAVVAAADDYEISEITGLVTALAAKASFTSSTADASGPCTAGSYHVRTDTGLLWHCVTTNTWVQFARLDDARFPTADEKAGLAANSPSAANPLLTQTQGDTYIDGCGSGTAQVGSTCEVDRAEVNTFTNSTSPPTTGALGTFHLKVDTGDLYYAYATDTYALVANMTATRTANTVLSGPASGGAAAPTYRALVGADLPNPGASSLGGTQSKTCTAGDFVSEISTSGVVTCGTPAAGGGLANVVEDTTPTLGGNLDGGGFTITNVASISVAGGGAAGVIGLTEGTAPTPGLNEVVIAAPPDVTTAYELRLPAASATGFMLGTNAANVNTVSYVAPTGTGDVVRATSPTLVTPALGTPSALVATNATGTAAGLTAGLATALAANGANCTNQFPRGVDASGAAEDCASVAATDIASDAVTTAKILNDNVTRDKVEAELRTGSFSFALTSPTTGENGFLQALRTHAITITRISCSVSGGGTSTATINIEERAAATPHTAGTDVLTANLVCDEDSAASTTFTNAGIAAQVPIALHIASVANAPTSLQVHVEYTID